MRNKGVANVRRLIPLLIAIAATGILASTVVDVEDLNDVTTAIIHIADSAIAKDTTALYLRDTTASSAFTITYGRHYTFQWAFITPGSDSDTVVIQLECRDVIGLNDFTYPWEVALSDTGAGAGTDTTGYKFLDADAAWCPKQWRTRVIYWDPADSGNWNIDELDTATYYISTKLVVRE